MSLDRTLQRMAEEIRLLKDQIADLKARETGGLWTRSSRAMTLSSGEIDSTAGALFVLTPETGAADDLDTINNPYGGKIVGLRTTSGNTITLKHGTGNLSLPGGSDVDLDDVKLLYTLVYDDDQTAWIPFSSQDTYSPPAPSTPTAVAGRINLGSIVDVTLSGDAFSLTTDRSFYRLTSESGTTDDLTDINGASDGDLIVIRANTSHTISVLDTGNINLNGSSRTLDQPEDMLTLVYSSNLAEWCESAWGAAGN